MSRRVGIVGAGIVGLAHAWSAAERGHAVTVFERSPRASGASIRNFGMIWPIGQSPGERHQTALHSRDRWLVLRDRAGLDVDSCGSIHLAHHSDEWRVLQEFSDRAPGLGFECQLLTPAEVARHTPAAQPAGLLGGLWSPTELRVDPPAAVRTLPAWLASTFGVEFEWNTTIVEAHTGSLRRADGRVWRGDHSVICTGADLETLFPEILQPSGLRRCKLQMLQTASQPKGWRLGPHLAGGLTLRHYPTFQVCAGLSALCERIATETPELDQFGIHVMASQTPSGGVILGDSHEYDDAMEPFDKQGIDDLILRELRRIIQLPAWEIATRWHGIYAKHPTRPIIAEEPHPGVFVRVGIGGTGMTLSLGMAEQDWQQWA
jgi:FAD dependent oxidoreductase TIGR03364